MNDEMMLPQRQNAASHKSITLNVPGIFLFSDLMYKLLDIVFDKTGYKIPIKYMYGAPQLRWNNGRLILNKYNNDFSMSGIEKELYTSVEKGIIPLLTFSNIYIDSFDLKDKKCNQVLEILDEIGGGVIISSSFLKDYIMEKYSNIKIHASVIMTAFEDNRTSAYYQQLSSEYEKYVIHPDDNFDLKLLKNVPKNNAEIIVNERCKINCKIRKEHYKAISKEQIAQTENRYIDSKFLDSCDMIPEIKQQKLMFRNTSLTNEEISNLINMGFDLFKLQGRTDNLYVFFFDLLRYTLDNDVVFPNIFPIFSYHIEKYIKEQK